MLFLFVWCGKRLSLADCVEWSEQVFWLWNVHFNKCCILLIEITHYHLAMINNKGHGFTTYSSLGLQVCRRAGRKSTLISTSRWVYKYNLFMGRSGYLLCANKRVTGLLLRGPWTCSTTSLSLLLAASSGHVVYRELTKCTSPFIRSSIIQYRSLIMY